ncbi:MAG: PIN domain-containing protein [Actinobacteria bacterium]|nr:PIN domain-containing protein [Actinomycetota bacterium]
MKRSPGYAGPFVFDAGAFIAFERRDIRIAVLVNGVLARERVGVTSAGVIAQVHRGDPRQARLNYLLNAEILLEAPLGSEEARLVGATMGQVDEPDVVDAHVALLTLRHGAKVITSDRRDMERHGVPADRIVDC